MRGSVHRLLAVVGLLALVAIARWATGCASDNDAGKVRVEQRQAALSGNVPTTVAAAISVAAVHRCEQQSVADAGSLAPAVDSGATLSDPDGGADSAAPPGASVAAGALSFARSDAGIGAVFGAGKPAVDLTLPNTADGRVQISDAKSGIRLTFGLSGASAATAETANGELVYRGGGPNGGDVVHRSAPEGTEDFVVLPTRGSAPELAYDLGFENVAGLRLVGSALELLDASGDPRLRMSAPLVRDAQCATVVPSIRLDGCSASTDPRPPWGLPLVSPGSTSCRVVVSWDDNALTYPIVVDPSWSTTTVPQATAGPFISVPNVSGLAFKPDDLIIAGGAIAGGETPSVQVYRWATNTWASLTALSSGRVNHTFSVTSDATGAQTRAIIVGGTISGFFYGDTPTFDLKTATWSYPAPISSPDLRRQGHKAVSLADGRVVITGGEYPAFTYHRELDIFFPGKTGGTYTQDTWLYDGTHQLAAGRMSHAAILIPPSDILVAGGWASPNRLSSAELFTVPSTGVTTMPSPTFPPNAVAAGTLSVGREWLPAARLASGKIMFAGGQGTVGGAGTSVANVDIYTPGSPGVAGTFAGSVPSLPTALSAGALLPILATTGGADQAVFVGGFTGSASGTLNIAYRYASTSGWSTITTALGSGHGFPAYGGQQSRRVMAATGFVGGTAAVTSSADMIDFCDEFCNDGNVCTTDACDGNGACVHTPVAQGQSCSDGDACNGAETCNATGACVSGVPVTCSNNNVCDGIETCNPATGQCILGTPLNCGTTNACRTVQGCDPVAGCKYTNSPAGTSCSDGLVCNGGETCDNNGNCLPGTNAPAGTVCVSDGNECDGTETCNGSGACVPPTSFVYQQSGIADPCYETVCTQSTGFVTRLKSSPASGCVVTPAASLDTSVPTDVADLANALAATQNPAAGTFTTANENLRSIVSGRVLSNGLAPYTAATVSVLGHPEFGQTQTQTNGRFDLAVNGGGTYVVSITDSQSFAIQRRVTVGWQDWNTVDDVVLTPTTGSDATTANFPLPVPANTYQLVVGPQTNNTDGDGTRKPVLILPPGFNVATPTGLVGPFNMGFHEYTVDSAGRARMPGDLPPASAYTYALELMLKTCPAGCSYESRDVTFNAPAIFYVKNFMTPAFAAGKTVPAGSYDRGIGAWTASNAPVSLGAGAGRVVKLIDGCSGGTGTANLDTNGDGQTDNCLPGFAPPCTTQVIPSGERQQLCVAGFASGDTVWRVPLNHFSAWDMNWGFGPPTGAGPPRPSGKPDARNDSSSPNPCLGSIIGCQNQSLGEEVPVVGTPYRLRYQSERQAGRQVAIKVPITGATPPGSTPQDPTPPIRIDVIVRIAGRILKQSVLPSFSANQSVQMVWDRLDGLGRFISGSSIAHVEVGNVYAGSNLYQDTPEFGYAGNGTPISGARAAREVTVWKYDTVTVEALDAKSLGFGGWTLSEQHVFDRFSRVLYLGNGGLRRFGEELESTLFNFGRQPLSGESEFHPSGVAVAPDGGVFTSINGSLSSQINRIWRTDSTGAAVRVAGTTAGTGGAPEQAIDTDTGSCVDADLNGIPDSTSPTADQPVQAGSMVAASDGSIFFLTDTTTSGGTHYGRIRRLFKYPQTSSGTWYIETIAGAGPTGRGTCMGRCDGRLGKELAVPNAVTDTTGWSAMAIGADGALYVSVNGAGNDHYVWRLVQDKQQPTSNWVCGHPPWVASALVGGGANTAAEGARAREVAFSDDLRAPTVAADGTLYFVQRISGTYPRVWAVEPSGTMHIIAGSSASAVASGDGGLASAATFESLSAMAWFQGSLYLLDRGTGASTPGLRVIDARGYIHAITRAGGYQVSPFNREVSPPSGVPALQGGLWQASALAIAGDGTKYVADTGNYRTRAIRAPSVAPCSDPSAGVTQCIPSEDGTEVYGFDDSGRHKWTKAALGGATKFSLAYTGSSLSTVTDATGNVTRITYPAGSVVLTAPFGQTTTISLSNGYATNIRQVRSASTNDYLDWAIGYLLPDGVTQGPPGLIQTFLRPGNTTASRLTYDSMGRLVADKDPTMTGSTTLGVGWLDQGRQVTLTTADGHRYTGRFETSPDGGVVSTMTDPADASTVTSVDLRGYTTKTELGGAVVTTVEPLDAGPRFGMLAPENVTERVTVAANAHQSALTSTTTTTTVAALSNQADVLSTTTATTTVTRAGSVGTAQATAASWTTDWSAATGIYTDKAPAVTNWVQRVVERTVDSKGRVTQIRYPNYGGSPGLTTVFSYPNPAPCSIPPVAGTTNCGGRLTQVQTTSSVVGETARTRTFSYDYGRAGLGGNDTGFVSSMVDPAGYRTTFGGWSSGALASNGRDDLGEPLVITRSSDALGGRQFVTNLGYDKNGNVNAVTPPHDTGLPTHSLISNAVDLLKQYQPPQITPTPLANKDTIYDYNQERRITAITVPWDATTRALVFGYDGFGRRQSVSDPIAATTTTTQYDGFGRVIQRAVTGAAAVTLDEVYAGNLPIQTTYSGSVTALLLKHYDERFHVVRRRLKKTTGSQEYNVENTYALDGLVFNARTRNTSDVDDAIVEYTARDALGNPTSVAVKRAVGTTALSEAWAYNGFGEPKSYSVTNGSTIYYQVSGPGVQSDVVRDANGRLLTVKETVAAIGGAPTSTTWSYEYDEGARLSAATKDGVRTAYTYDANGNRLTAGAITFTYDEQDRIKTSSSNTTRYGFTNSGALSQRTVSGQTTSYTYDLLGNLRSVAPPPPAPAITYVTDGRNRRVTKLIGGSPVRSWVYDDQLRVAGELDPTPSGGGAFTHIYAYGDRHDVPELVYEPATAKSYRIISDFRGSVRLVVDLGATPTVRQRIDYDAWGTATTTTNTSGDTAFTPISLGFAGGLWDQDTGLVRFGARDYDPQTGRWTAKDPIRLDGGLNLFAYVENDPVGNVDPNGLAPNRPGWDICDLPIVGFLWCNIAGLPTDPPLTPGSPGRDGLGFGPLTDEPVMCPEPPPNNRSDCADECEPYLGKGRSYRGNDGHTYRNDLGGQHAFQRCVAECEGTL